MRLLTLNDMCQQVNKLYNKYKEKKAALAKKSKSPYRESTMV